MKLAAVQMISGPDVAPNLASSGRLSAGVSMVQAPSAQRSVAGWGGVVSAQAALPVALISSVAVSIAGRSFCVNRIG